MGDREDRCQAEIIIGCENCTSYVTREEYDKKMKERYETTFCPGAGSNVGNT